MLSVSHWGLFRFFALENHDSVFYCHLIDGEWFWAIC